LARSREWRAKRKKNDKHGKNDKHNRSAEVCVIGNLLEGQFVSGLVGTLTGVVTGSGLLLLLGRRVIERMASLGRRVEQDQEKRLSRIESDLQEKAAKYEVDRIEAERREFASGCRRHQIAGIERELDETKRRVGGTEQAVGELNTGFARVETTIANQAGAFRDMSQKLDKYFDATGRLDERIGATDAHLQELHRTVSTHRDNRSMHRG
jgi:hypothetical protein